jgi:hypothetical protein
MRANFAASLAPQREARIAQREQGLPAVLWRGRTHFKARRLAAADVERLCGSGLAEPLAITALS